ncbi:MAG: hypothetical protein AAF438_19690 [Pseudomonadota bacterium]
MKTLSYNVFLFCILNCLNPVYAAETTTKIVRNQGTWEVQCSTKLPSDSSKLDQTIGRLRTKCEIEALKLGVKDHARSGSSTKAELSQQKIDRKKQVISVVAKVVRDE